MMRRIEMTPVEQCPCSTCGGPGYLPGEAPAALSSAAGFTDKHCPRCGGLGVEPTVIELVEGKRYFAVVRCPVGATEMNRRRAMEATARCLDRPEHPCAVVALPYGYQVDVYEEDAKNASICLTT